MGRQFFWQWCKVHNISIQDTNILSQNCYKVVMEDFCLQHLDQSLAVLTYAWHCCDAAQIDLGTVTLVSAEGRCPSFSASNFSSPETLISQFTSMAKWQLELLCCHQCRLSGGWLCVWPPPLCRPASRRAGGAPGTPAHTPASLGSECCSSFLANHSSYPVDIAWCRKDPDIVHQDDTQTDSISEI